MVTEHYKGSFKPRNTARSATFIPH